MRSQYMLSCVQTQGDQTLMKKLTLPMDKETRTSLKAGEEVLLSGVVYTARDAAHKRLVHMLECEEPLPIDLNNAAIYYVGPTPACHGHAIGSAGPTTSSRMDAYTPMLLEEGLRVMIGKGRRSDAVKDAIRKYGAVYFVACGGAGALLSHCIIESEPVAFDDLLAEAIVRLTLKDFPCFVGIDVQGNDIYDLEDDLKP